MLELDNWLLSTLAEAIADAMRPVTMTCSRRSCSEFASCTRASLRQLVKINFDTGATNTGDR